MTAHTHVEPPSPFVAEWISAAVRLFPSRRRALDVAMGRGRHAKQLVEQGFDVFGVDVHLETLRAASAALGLGGSLKIWCADLTSFPLPFERFEVIVVRSANLQHLKHDIIDSARGVVMMDPGAFLT